MRKAQRVELLRAFPAVSFNLPLTHLQIIPRRLRKGSCAALHFMLQWRFFSGRSVQRASFFKTHPGIAPNNN
jgi:hypothetical protein